MSSCSSDHHQTDEDLYSHTDHHHTDEDLYSQQDMDTGSERGQVSDDEEENTHFSHDSEDEEDHDEVQSLKQIEECFLRQLDDNKGVTTSFTNENYVNPECCSGQNKMEESVISVTESNEANSGLTTSDGEEGIVIDSGKSLMSLEKRVDAEMERLVANI